MGDRRQAQIFFNTAIVAVNEASNPQRFTHGYQLFSSAALTDPTWWEGLFQAGNNCSDLEHKEAAVACYRRALQCQPEGQDLGKVYTNLGWKLHQLGRTEEALHWSRKAVELVANEPYAWVNLSCIHQILNNTREGLRCAQKALEVAPDDAMVTTCHAFALLFDGRWASGLKAFESRFKYELKNFLQFPYPKWQGEEGKTVYLVSDQGLGDTLSYARFVRETCKRSKYVHAYIHPPLLRAFNHAFVDIQNLNLTPTSTPYPAADYWTTFVSLPYALGLSDEEIINAKQIDIPIYAVTRNWRVPDRKLHVGIAWAGSPLNKIDIHRNVPVKQFFSLCQVPGVQLYSMQVGDKSVEMHNSGGSPLIRDIVPYINDIVDTAALLQHLDLVICCESAMGHICAALGKECWMPYSRLGKDYRMGIDGTKQLWSKHRPFLQGADLSWEPVFEQICQALEERRLA
jgi:hypothetical protein